ncbi:uncharacterized protein [Amphiura filiformis]|uniref:uncharacterized protein n=1 Tax=Amphiura filiformis TaxID=82378 RepID=UPI003B2233E3
MLTTLHISDDDAVTILPEDFYEGKGDKVLILLSNQPVMVSQYLTGYGIQTFESMIIIPPVTSYTSNVTFSVFRYEGITFESTGYHPARYYINVVMECTYIDGLLLDNQATVWDDELSSDNKEMCCVRKDIDTGEHYVEHANPNAKFFVYVYGICSGECASSYVYPASDVYFRKEPNGRTTLPTSTEETNRRNSLPTSTEDTNERTTLQTSTDETNGRTTLPTSTEEPNARTTMNTLPKSTGVDDNGMTNEYVFTVPTVGPTMVFGYGLISFYPHVFITTPSRDPVNVTLSFPSLNNVKFRTIDRDHHVDITLPFEFRLNHGDGKQNVTGIIRSSGMVTVHVIDTGYIESDIFTVYSSSRLGNVYYVATYTPHTSFFCVTALSPDTVVSVRKKFQQINIYHLRQYESYRFDGSGGEDLSGTRIESNKPVAVIAGGIAAIGRVGLDTGWVGYGDEALEQLPPVSSWGHTHVLAPFLYARPYVFRVYAGTMLTTLHISDDDAVTILPEDFYEGIGDKVLILLSNQPVMVSQYYTGNGIQNFESMIIIPPVTSYTSNVTFSVFRYEGISFESSDYSSEYHPDSYYINVVMECTYIDGLLLDNQATVWDDQLSSDNKEMCCVRKDIDTGEHYIEHENPNAKFFVYVYGICSGECASSYVYPASDVYFRKESNGCTTLPTSTEETNGRTTSTEETNGHTTLPTSTGVDDSEMTSEYVFTVPTVGPTVTYKRLYPHVFITTPSKDPVAVTLSIPSLNYASYHTIDREHHADITLPFEFRLNLDGGKQNVTGIIRTSGMITVHVIDTEYIESDIFTVYSSSRLGNLYYVATYTPDTSFFCVTAIFPDTVVSVRKKFQQNNIYHLRQYESYSFDGSDGEDLSGTRIESNKPVAVIAGGNVAIRGWIGNGDGALEQLPPVSSWGHTYVLAPFLYSDLYVFRVYAGTMFTTLHISNNDTVTILPEDFYEGTGDKVLTLISDQPVMVSQYLTGRGRQNFESMIIIPPVTSYTSNVTFSVFRYKGFRNNNRDHLALYYINVVMECTYINGLLLDNQETVWDDQLSSDNKEMCCVRKGIDTGEHYIEHANPNAQFFVYVYSICSGRCASSYVYPASDVYFRNETNGRTTLPTSTDGEADDPCQQVTVISRNDWGAETPTTAVKNLAGSVSYSFIHHTDGLSCSNQSECSSRVRGIQNYHMNTKGWKDIGYSFLIGEDGNAYEGRGWDQKGAHTKGYNDVGLAFSFIGNFMRELPNQAARDMAQNMIACGVQLGKIRSDYTLRGHRDMREGYKPTDCPGDALYAEIQTWPHY